MRSRDNRLARERVLRGVALLALGVLAVRLWMGPGSVRAASVGSAGLDSALVVWSAHAPAAVTLHATRIPSRAERDWLVALRRTGSIVRWSAADSAATALVIEPALPAGAPSRVTALGSAGAPVTLHDALGFVDSAHAGRDGAVSWRVSPVGVTTAASMGTHASAVVRDSLSAKPVLVAGQAGWESRFVVTALEEAGWQVRATLTVAPGAVVRLGDEVRIDTSSIGALVALDSTSVLDAAAVSRFVRAGGGLVAAGAAVNHPALRAVVPSRSNRSSPGELGALHGPDPRRGLAARVLQVSGGSVPVERRDGVPLIVARRVGSGRVTAVGYDDTWRLRMAPPDDNAPDDHRRWWSSLVAGVAHRTVTTHSAPLADEAPFASTVHVLGDPDATAGETGMELPWDRLLALLAMGTLLAEWGSRRLRGQA